MAWPHKFMKIIDTYCQEKTDDALSSTITIISEQHEGIIGNVPPLKLTQALILEHEMRCANDALKCREKYFSCCRIDTINANAAINIIIGLYLLPRQCHDIY